MGARGFNAKSAGLPATIDLNERELTGDQATIGAMTPP